VKEKEKECEMVSDSLIEIPDVFRRDIVVVFRPSELSKNRLKQRHKEVVVQALVTVSHSVDSRDE
jgi:hypothetical protein